MRLLYRYILLREPSEGEVDYQASALATVSRAQLTSNFLNSHEFRNGVGPRLTAFLLYATLLSRDGSEGELTGMELQLRNNVSLRSVVDSVLNSVEFASVLE